MCEETRKILGEEGDVIADEIDRDCQILSHTSRKRGQGKLLLQQLEVEKRTP